MQNIKTVSQMLLRGDNNNKKGSFSRSEIFLSWYYEKNQFNSKSLLNALKPRRPIVSWLHEDVTYLLKLKKNHTPNS